MCFIRISAMIRSVRQSARRFLTTFSLFTSGPPQHESDDDAERKGRRHRCNRALRDQRLDMVLLFAQGLAELIQGGPYRDADRGAPDCNDGVCLCARRLDMVLLFAQGLAERTGGPYR